MGWSSRSPSLFHKDLKNELKASRSNAPEKSRNFKALSTLVYGTTSTKIPVRQCIFPTPSGMWSVIQSRNWTIAVSVKCLENRRACRGFCTEITTREWKPEGLTGLEWLAHLVPSSLQPLSGLPWWLESSVTIPYSPKKNDGAPELVPTVMYESRLFWLMFS